MDKLYMNEEWLRYKIIDEGLTHHQVAELCDDKHFNVRHWAKKYGIERPKSTKKKDRLENAKKCKDREWLFNQYISLDKSYDTIANEFNIGKTTVARWVKKHDLIKETPQQFRSKRKDDRPPIEMVCIYCSKTTLQKYAKVKKGDGVFCSQSCSAKYRYENGGSDKLTEALQVFYDSEEGQKIMKLNGVKGYLSQKRSDTSIEIITEDILTDIGVKFIKQKQLYYWVTDFYLPDYDLVIEALGDYWHANPKIYTELSSMQKKNVRRDRGKEAYLTKCGHNYIDFWESDLKKNREQCVSRLKSKISGIVKASA